MSSFALNFEVNWSMDCSICGRLLSIFCSILATGMLFTRLPSQLGNAEDRLLRFRPAAIAVVLQPEGQLIRMGLIRKILSPGGRSTKLPVVLHQDASLSPAEDESAPYPLSARPT